MLLTATSCIHEKTYYSGDTPDFLLRGKVVDFSIELSESMEYQTNILSIWIKNNPENIDIDSISYFLTDSITGKSVILDTTKSYYQGEKNFYMIRNFQGNIDFIVKYKIISNDKKNNKTEIWKNLKQRKKRWFSFAFH